MLVSQGKGRKRLIVLPGGKPTRSMKIALLLYEPIDRQLEYIVEPLGGKVGLAPSVASGLHGTFSGTVPPERRAKVG
jgi:hypothetical protein